MGIALRLMAFVFMTNVFALVLTNIGGGLWESPVAGNSYSAELATMEGNVTGFPADSSSSSFFLIRIFDYITLGYMSKILSFTYNLLFGFIPILENIGIYNPITYPWIHSMLISVITFIYIMGSIELYTGRNMSD